MSILLSGVPAPFLGISRDHPRGSMHSTIYAYLRDSSIMHRTIYAYLRGYSIMPSTIYAYLRAAASAADLQLWIVGRLSLAMFIKIHTLTEEALED